MFKERSGTTRGDFTVLFISPLPPCVDGGFSDVTPSFVKHNQTKKYVGNENSVMVAMDILLTKTKKAL